MKQQDEPPPTLNYERPSQEPKGVRGWIVLLVMAGCAVGMPALCYMLQRLFK